MAKEKKVTLANYKEQFVTLFPTEINKHHEQGKAFKAHPDMAKHLISKGFATEEEPEGYEAPEDDE